VGDESAKYGGDVKHTEPVRGVSQAAHHPHTQQEECLWLGSK
jgi:hypothetical protein